LLAFAAQHLAWLAQRIGQNTLIILVLGACYILYLIRHVSRFAYGIVEIVIGLFAIFGAIGRAPEVVSDPAIANPLLVQMAAGMYVVIRGFDNFAQAEPFKGGGAAFLAVWEMITVRLLSVSYVKDSILFLKRLPSWVPEMARWLWEVNRLWLPALAVVFIIVLVVGVVPAIWPCQVERVVRFAGGLLQLGGGIMIVLKLRDALRQFPGETLAQWRARQPPFWPQNKVINLAGASSSMTTGRAGVCISSNPPPTLEQRLAKLEESHTKLVGEIKSLGNEVRRRSDELTGKLQAEATTREAADKEIREQLKEAAVGSFHLDLWGVTFVLLGIVAGALSPEAAILLGAAGCK
jgi:hypothetical protein